MKPEDYHSGHKQERHLHNHADSPSQEYTEVFSWGSDKWGQLGLGKQGSSQKQFNMVPRFCSYNIPITQVACGASHSVFITSKKPLSPD